MVTKAMEEEEDLEEEEEEEDEEEYEDDYGDEDDEIQSNPPSIPTPNPPQTSNPNGPLTAPSQPVTVAAPPHQTLTLALPIQHPRTGVTHGREDCWSEGATATLIDAWGERYLELSRGNLKQKHWKDVADVVSSREDYTKPSKTDVQCKNRIDTLKKKYKVEKARIGTGAGPSKWAFFHRLDRLIGPSRKPNSTTAAPATPAPASKIAVVGFSAQRNFQLPIQQQGGSSNSAGAAAPDSTDSFPPVANPKKRRIEREAVGSRGRNSVRELTRAIVKIGEVYERVERSKLQQVMEFEKKRMGFAKDLELQRMQFFMKTQLELAQMEHGRVGNSNNSNNTG